jgi:phosphonate transport system permease protein
MSMASVAVPQARPRPPSRLARRTTIGLLLLAVMVAAITMDVELDRLLRLPAQLARTVGLMFPPAVAYLGRAAEGMVESIQIAWIGTLIGALVSLPLGMLGAKNISGFLGSNAIRQLLNAIRAIPELVLAAVIFIPMIGLGPFSGTLAIGLHSVGTLGKLTAEVVEGIDEGPVEAARAAGAKRLQILRWGVLPQVLPEIVAFWLYRFEINVRASAILGVVGAGGIGTILANNVSYGRWENVGTTIIVIVASVIVIDTASGWLRRRIIEGGAGPSGGAELEQPELVDVRRPQPQPVTARADTEIA